MTNDTAAPVRHMTRAEASRVTCELLAANGLAGWSVRFDTAVSRAGRCSYSKRTISLSLRVMEVRTYEGTLNTIRHEVAHALTQGHNHDKVWSEKYKELGGDGKRCVDGETLVKPVEGRYRGHCVKCSRVFWRHRIPARQSSCPYCNSRRFDRTCLIEFLDQKTGRTIRFDESGRRV